MSNKPKTEQYAVAFIDFLGVKEMMANDSDGKLLIVFRAACDAATHMCRKILSSDEEQITIKMFSDNVVLCRRVYSPASHSDDIAGALRRVTMAASMFQFFILDTMGALVRGGVTVGQLYIDSMMVWGQSLVDAYRLENETAVYPRIILDPKLNEGDFCTGLLKDEAIALDDDGKYYLDYIHTVWKFHRPKSYEESLSRFQKTNFEEMSSHCDLPAVMQKRQWQERYLDRIWEMWLIADTAQPNEYAQGLT